MLTLAARVTYADGFAKNMAATQAAQEAKNRTIGHYVVGKPPRFLHLQVDR